MPLPTAPQTLGALQAMQTIILNECLVSSASPFATLSATDQTRYGIAKAIFVGKPKDFKDGYLPQCNLWVPSGDEPMQPVELAGYSGTAVGGRAFAEVEAIVSVYVDLRTDWYAGEQQILQIRDALWPALLKHELLGGGVAGVIESWAREGRGLCYEQVAGIEYRCYEALWGFRQQWSLAGGRMI
jgi:hypothetical protein